MASIGSREQPVVLVQRVPEPEVKPNTPDSSWGKIMIAFGAISIIAGLGYFIYQLAGVGTVMTSHAGIWGGIMLMLTGSLGVAAGAKGENGLVIAVLTLSIVSDILAAIIIPTILGIEAAVHNRPTAEVTGVLVTLFLLGFISSLALSIQSCVVLCSSSSRKIQQQQFVMMTPEGQAVPVQVQTGATATSPERTYTSLQKTTFERPPPYPGTPGPPPGGYTRDPVRRSADDHVYCEVVDPVDTGAYLHALPPVYDDGYILPTEANRESEGIRRPEALPQKKEHPLPPIPT